MLGSHRDGSVDPSQKQRRDTSIGKLVSWIVHPTKDKNENAIKPENYLYEYAASDTRNEFDDDITNEKTPKYPLRATKSFLNDLMAHLDKIEIPSSHDKHDSLEIRHGNATVFSCLFTTQLWFSYTNCRKTVCIFCNKSTT